MKTSNHLSTLTAGLILCAVAVSDAGAASSRSRNRGPDPNTVDALPSPFQGTVANVSATTLSVRGEVKMRQTSAKESDTISFSIKPETTITRNGKPAQFKDIQKDEFVSVTFSTKKGSSLKHVTEIAVGKDSADVQEKRRGGKKKK